MGREDGEMKLRSTRERKKDKVREGERKRER